MTDSPLRKCQTGTQSCQTESLAESICKSSVCNCQSEIGAEWVAYCCEEGIAGQLREETAIALMRRLLRLLDCLSPLLQNQVARRRRSVGSTIWLHAGQVEWRSVGGT